MAPVMTVSGDDPVPIMQEVTLPQDLTCQGCVIRLLKLGKDNDTKFMESCADINLVTESKSQITFKKILTCRFQLHLPGMDHILAQSLKRCSASRIKPNETFELAKKRESNSVGGGGRKNFFTLSPSYKQSPKNRENLFVLQFCSWDGSFRHGEMKISLCLYFQHVTRYIGTDFVEESRWKIQRSEEEENVFREGVHW